VCVCVMAFLDMWLTCVLWGDRSGRKKNVRTIHRTSTKLVYECMAVLADVSAWDLLHSGRTTSG
jgi:hypothetical protein